MMRSLCFLLLLLGWSALCAQDPAAITARARQYLDTLTSPAFHGRGYVNNGQGIAAEWIARQYARLGLQPVKQDYFQPFAFNVNSFPDSMGVRVDGRQLVPGIEFLVAPSSGRAEGSFTLVHMAPADLWSPERKAMSLGVLTGKAACVHWPATKDRDSLQRFQALERELLHYGPVVKAVPGKLTWSVSQESLPFPLIEVANGLLTDSSATVDIHVRNRMLVRHPARNVLGMVKGRSKDWVVVSAHYDHLGRMGPDALFPGANDNASGVAMLLSLAEWFTQHTPKHNILFVAFAGEEAGLVGSEWCAVDRPIDFGRVKLMVNLDILGTGDDGITVVNATAEQAHFDRLVALNAEKGLLKEVKPRGPACNSDHCPFVKRGIPAIFIYTLGGVAYYHDVLDKAETLPLTEFADLHQLLREFIGTIK